MFCVKFETIEIVKISATVITFNEENNIEKAILSVNWADEVIVVDSNSTDKTVEIAESLGAKVIIQPWLGFAKQKQFAVDSANNDWIFSLDADEIVSGELALEIATLLKTNKTSLANAYRIPRLSYYMNRPIRHSGWYPDSQIRFFDRRKAKWKDVLIHESIEVDGETANLKSDILHYSVENAAHHHKMIGERYAPLSAKQMFENDRRTTKFRIKTVGITTFLQVYILKLGFLDGLPGFCIARFAAHHAFLKHLMLWEMQKDKASGNTTI
jgi:glycosyltransferase involved in cell wall biosynthesis